MPPVSNAPIIAAIIAKKRRKIFEAFRASSATSPTNGKTLADLGVKNSNLFRIQVRRKVIVQLQDDKYYLDEARLKELDQLRHRLAFISITAVIIIALILLLNR